MAAPSSDDRANDPASPAGGEGVFHNSVLMRASKPVGANHSWAVPAVLCVALVAGAIAWGVMAAHPQGPVVNHAVADAPTSFASGGPG